MNHKHIVLLVILCHQETFAVTRNLPETFHRPCTRLNAGPITIFIHGTVFPTISRFMGHHEERRGLYHYTANPKRLTGRQRLGRILYTADAEAFPLKNFYKYYWSGDLSLQARKQAAEELFKLLKDHQGPCTIIAHSHGCNVALHLAEYAQNSSLRIDRLILLAPPVQEVTRPLVHAPIFKRVYSCYSAGDLVQIADPQGIQKSMRQGNEKLPLFSRRTYQKGPNLTQAQITFDTRSPGHRDFILVPFFSQLPAILKLLDTPLARQQEQVIVDVPFKGRAPQLLIEKKQEKGMLSVYKRSRLHRKQ